MKKAHEMTKEIKDIRDTYKELKPFDDAVSPTGGGAYQRYL